MSDIILTPEYLRSVGLGENFPERFWSKVKKTETCWLFTGCINDDGYGYIGAILIAKKRMRIVSAHVASYLMHKGPIAKGLIVRHKCPTRTPSCVRPEHLILGTKAQNTQDAVELLHAVGAAHWNARLTIEQIEEIRILSKHGHSNVDLGKRFGVSPHHISKIKNRKCWLHTSPEPLDGSGWVI